MNKKVPICNVDKVREQAMSTIFYDFNNNNVLQLDRHLPSYRTKVCVKVGDCIQAAIILKEQYNLKPLVLNMACAGKPGGGYKGGAGAQEENLFRRSNYYQILEDPDKFDKDRTWKYPLDEFSAVYSPSVTVFRESEGEGYRFLPYPIDISFIAMPAYNSPTIIDNQLTEKYAENTKQKMRIIFHIALVNGHDSLVLSAMGCGAFKNPPRHIALLFKEVMEEEAFSGKFKYLVFAIIDDGNTGKAHNPQGNIVPFLDVFSTVPQNFEKVDDITTSTSNSSNQENPLKDSLSQSNNNKRSLTKSHQYNPTVPTPREDTIYFQQSLKNPSGFDYFSTLFEAKFEIDKKTWSSIEQYLSYKKYKSSKSATQIQNLQSPNKIVQLCLSLPNTDISKDWENDKKYFMLEATFHKFSQNQHLRNFLVETGKTRLIYIDQDDYWGSGPKKNGKNHMGQILMTVREMLKGF
jgi:uncharacterized protein (TIGR02452 family)